MSPEQIDRFALSLRDGIKAQVERTAQLKVGAMVLATLDPMTGEELESPAPIPLFPLHQIANQEDMGHFGTIAADVVAKTSALAILVFGGVKGDADERFLWISYERVRASSARNWHATVNGNQVGEFSERLSPLAFFKHLN